MSSRRWSRSLHCALSVSLLSCVGSSCTGQQSIVTEELGAQGPIEVRVWDLAHDHVSILRASSMIFTGEKQQDMRVFDVQIDAESERGIIYMRSAQADIEQDAAQAIHMRQEVLFTGNLSERTLTGSAQTVDIYKSGADCVMIQPDFYWGKDRLRGTRLVSRTAEEEVHQLEQAIVNMTAGDEPESQREHTVTGATTVKRTAHSYTLTTALLELYQQHLVRGQQTIYIDGVMDGEPLHATAASLAGDITTKKMTLQAFHGAWGSYVVDAQRVELAQGKQVTLHTVLVHTALVKKELAESEAKKATRKDPKKRALQKDFVDIKSATMYIDSASVLRSDVPVQFSGMLNGQALSGHAARLEARSVKGVRGEEAVSEVTTSTVSETTTGTEAVLQQVVGTWGGHAMRAESLEITAQGELFLHDFVGDTPVRNGQIRMRSARMRVDEQRLLSSEETVHFSGTITGKRIDGTASSMHGGATADESILMQPDFMWGSQHITGQRMVMVQQAAVVLHDADIETPFAGGVMRMRTQMITLDDVHNNMRIQQRIFFTGQLDNKKVVGTAEGVEFAERSTGTGSDAVLRQADFMWGSQHITADTLNIRNSEALSGENWRVIPEPSAVPEP